MSFLKISNEEYKEGVDNPLDVSFIIVSWNVSALLGNCIQSIVKHASDLTYEIIVVDNHSSDQTISMVRTMYPWVKLLANSENVGFAKANNQGFNIAIGRYIFVLNPDTLIEKNTLQRLVTILKNCPAVGMVGPKIIQPDGKIQTSCARLLPTLSSCFILDTLRIYKLPFVGCWFSKKYSTPYFFDVSQTVESISGAAMLIRYEVIAQIKGFGEHFIHAGEDIDLCFHVRKAGWEIYYDCEAIVKHLGGQSSSQVPIQTMINVVISQQEYFSRCFGAIQGLLYRMIIQCIELPLIIIVGIVKLVFCRETIKEFKIRLSGAKGIWKWREVK